jgi:hypothetical protein
VIAVPEETEAAVIDRHPAQPAVPARDIVGRSASQRQRDAVGDERPPRLLGQCQKRAAVSVRAEAIVVVDRPQRLGRDLEVVRLLAQHAVQAAEKRVLRLKGDSDRDHVDDL